MIKIPAIFKERIFFLAILISVACHLFWIAAVRIKVSEGKAKQVRFSKVSFLGPYVLKTGTVARISPLERTFLEKRFAGMVEKVREASPEPLSERVQMPNIRNESFEKDLSYLISEAVGRGKLQPDAAWE